MIRRCRSRGHLTVKNIIIICGIKVRGKCSSNPQVYYGILIMYVCAVHNDQVTNIII